MKIAILTCAGLVGTNCFAGLEAGTDLTSSKSAIEHQSNDNRWSVGVGYISMFNIKAKFSGLGGYSNPRLLQPLGGGVDYEYDDGFVRVDSSGNLGGQTWNWVYDNAAQYNPAGTGSVQYSLANVRSDATAEEDNEAAHGVEIHAAYDCGELDFDIGGLSKPRWGLKFSVSATGAEIDNRESTFATVRTVADTFNLGGVVPPQNPWTQGSFNGPGPLISDSPTRLTTDTANAAVLGHRDVDLFLSTAQAGAYLELPITERMHCELEAGITMALAYGEASFSSTTYAPNQAIQTNSGSSHDTDLLPGFYLGASFVHEIDERFSVFGSLRYQFLQDFEIKGDAGKADIEFDSMLAATLGVRYSF